MNTEQRERLQAWIGFYTALFLTGDVPVFDPPPIQNDTDTPDDQGEVELLKLPEGWKGWRHNIAEIANGSDLTDDQRGHALANLSEANGRYNVGFMGFIGACYASSPTGPGLPYSLDMNAPIEKTQSWPNVILTSDGIDYNLGKVQGVADWCTKLGKHPGPNEPADPHGHVPGA